jgi:hypothetical protein
MTDAVLDIAWEELERTCSGTWAPWSQHGACYRHHISTEAQWDRRNHERETADMASGEHSAAASAGGYLYQIRWALVNLLRNAATRPDQVISLEMHDDVAWANLDGTPTELLQTKLHASAAAGLGDKDTDMWKTLLIWLKRADATDPNGPELALVTTSTAQPGTAAHALRPDPVDRDVDDAVTLLTAAASTSDNKATEPGRTRFRALSPAQRATLLHRVRVLDTALAPEDLDSAVRHALTVGLPSGELAQSRFVAEVWRWWDAVTLDMLGHRRDGVSVGQLLTFLYELRDSFGPDGLWTTVQLDDVSDDDIDAHFNDRFVHQLKLVRYPAANLRRAVIDYYRAVTQETQWIDDSLLGLHELRRFEDNLRDEWQRAFTDMIDDLADGAENYNPVTVEEKVKVAAGKKLLRALMESTAVSIRKHYDDPFFARGKRHELADRDSAGGLGWHPDFADRLAAVIATP